MSPPHFDMSNEGLISWMEKLISDKVEGRHNLAFFLVVCWQIWDTRNQWIFKQVPPSPSKVIHVAEATVRDYLLANPTKVLRRKSMENCIKWKPPDQGFIKLNFDGSVIKDQGTAIGFIIRDDEGCPIFAGSKSVPSHHVPITEALALREGLRLALRQNLFKVQVEGDSKLIIDCVLNKCSVPWPLKMVIRDIQWLATQFQVIQFFHVFREANFTADALANLGHHSSSVGYWNCCLPASVNPALQFDCSNLGCSRGFRL